jgi:TolB-like protein
MILHFCMKLRDGQGVRRQPAAGQNKSYCLFLYIRSILPVFLETSGKKGAKPMKTYSVGIRVKGLFSPTPISSVGEKETALYVPSCLRQKILPFLCCLLLNPFLFAQQKSTVAVATFDVMGGVTKDEAQVVTELFIAELVSKGSVNVVDRVNFDKIIAEMKFQTEDWSDSQKTVRLGQALNAGFVIRGQLMKMGSVIYWTATMLDVKTAQVLYSAREQISDLGQIYGKLPSFCQQIVTKIPNPKPDWAITIGGRGLGGGYVFYIEGNTAMEVSPLLGQYPWSAALNAASAYRGGGFSDWKLPSQSELNRIYQNLKKGRNMALGDEVYWSSTEYRSDSAWLQRFSDGYQDKYGYSKTGSHCVRAVRAFNF